MMKMKRWKKIACIIAVVCIVLSFVIDLVGVPMARLLIAPMLTSKQDDSTKVIEEDFSNIDIRISTHVTLAQSADGRCYIEYRFPDEMPKHTVTVADDTLIIAEENFPSTLFLLDDRQVCLTLYLPQTMYETISIEGVNGDITVDGDFDVQTAHLTAQNGDVAFSVYAVESLSAASANGDLDINRAQGDKWLLEAQYGNIAVTAAKPQTLTAATYGGEINVQSLMVDGDTHLSTEEGDIRVVGTLAQNHTLRASRGDITFENSFADGQINLTTDTGDIELDKCNAPSMVIETGSGDVEGTLTAPKQFITQTDSGAVSVPQSPDATERCEITTKSGDIQIMVK